MSSKITYAAAATLAVTQIDNIMQVIAPGLPDNNNNNNNNNNIAPGLPLIHQPIIIRSHQNTNQHVNRPYPPKHVRNAVDKKQLGHGSPPSLCLPRVPITFDPNVLLLSPLAKYGNIALVDLSLQFDKILNTPFFMAFVHFNSWDTTQEATQELNNICNNNTRVVYPHNIGSVVENTSVDKFLSLSGYDSFHTQDIDKQFERFWENQQQDKLFWECIQDEYRQDKLLKEIE